MPCFCWLYPYLIAFVDCTHVGSATSRSFVFLWKLAKVVRMANTFYYEHVLLFFVVLTTFPPFFCFTGYGVYSLALQSSGTKIMSEPTVCQLCEREEKKRETKILVDQLQYPFLYFQHFLCTASLLDSRHT